jgi:hypothetical protein
MNPAENVDFMTKALQDIDHSLEQALIKGKVCFEDNTEDVEIEVFVPMNWDKRRVWEEFNYEFNRDFWRW